MSDGQDLNELNNISQPVLTDTDLRDEGVDCAIQAYNEPLKDESEERITVEVEGKEAVLITLPNIEVARLKLYADGSACILPRDDFDADEQQLAPEPKATRVIDSLTPNENDFYPSNRGTGAASELLSPHAEELFPACECAPGAFGYGTAAASRSARYPYDDLSADSALGQGDSGFADFSGLGAEENYSFDAAQAAYSEDISQPPAEERYAFDSPVSSEQLLNGGGSESYTLDSSSDNVPYSEAANHGGADTYYFSDTPDGLTSDSIGDVRSEDYSPSPYDYGLDEAAYGKRGTDSLPEREMPELYSDAFSLPVGVKRRVAVKQIDRAKNAAAERARMLLREQELLCLEDELSFSKKFQSPWQRRQIKERRRSLKAAKAAIRKREREAEMTAKRYCLPTAEARRVISLSVDRERSVTLMDKLVKLCRHRDAVNKRLCDLYRESERGKHRGSEGRARAKASGMKKAYKKQYRIAKAIHRERVNSQDRERLCRMMDEQVRLCGEIKAIEYSLNKEKKFGGCAARLRRRRRELLLESGRLKKEISRLELSGVRGARARRNSHTGMLIGWSAFLILAVLGFVGYLFREPIWEWFRGFINWIMDMLGWTHFGRL